MDCILQLAPTGAIYHVRLRKYTLHQFGFSNHPCPAIIFTIVMYKLVWTYNASTVPKLEIYVPKKCALGISTD